MNLRNGTKKSREERSQVEVATLVEEVGLGGADGLDGLMMTISGKKHNKLVLLC